MKGPPKSLSRERMALLYGEDKTRAKVRWCRRKQCRGRLKRWQRIYCSRDCKSIDLRVGRYGEAGSVWE